MALTVMTAGDGRFRRYIDLTLDAAAEFGYRTVVYDLGGLGVGIPFAIDDPVFRSTGYYPPIPGTSKLTRALHKPELVDDCLRRHPGPAVYLDGDAVLARRIDELEAGDYDVAVTVREPWEVEKISRLTDAFKRLALGYVNAGVVAFAGTPGCAAFVERWRALTREARNDQYALNVLAAPWQGPALRPSPGSAATVDGIRVRYLAALEYNHFYLGLDGELRELSRQPARIYHFREGRARAAFGDWLASRGGSPAEPGPGLHA